MLQLSISKSDDSRCKQNFSTPVGIKPLGCQNIQNIIYCLIKNSTSFRKHVKKIMKNIEHILRLSEKKSCMVAWIQGLLLVFDRKWVFCSQGKKNFPWFGMSWEKFFNDFLHSVIFRKALCNWLGIIKTALIRWAICHLLKKSIPSISQLLLLGDCDFFSF